MAEALIAIGLFLVDPFDLSAQKARMIDRLIARLSEWSYKSPAADKTAVVLIDQETLDKIRADWPFSYGIDVEMIRQLACAHAAAAFFDFTAANKYNLGHDSLQLIAAVRDSSSVRHCDDGSQPGKIPIFFGKTPKISSPAEDELDAGGHALYIDTTAPESIYSVGFDEFPAQPLEIRDMTPAFGLARTICGNADADSELNCAGIKQATNDTRPLSLTWNAYTNDLQHAVRLTGGCRKPLPFDLKRIRNVIGYSIFGWWESASIQRCPPIFTLSGGDLFPDFADIEQHGDRRPYLKGRIVFVGVDLSGLPDVVTSPIHGRIPGIYVHAMAFDNLVKFGDDYYSTPSDSDTYVFLAVYFLGMGLIGEFVSPAASFWVRRLEKKPAGRSHLFGWRFHFAWTAYFAPFILWNAILLGVVVMLRWPASTVLEMLSYGVFTTLAVKGAASIYSMKDA
ncbi:MAG TPA: CHASE2 domain-containing protein [Magnetospirillaceae bacterium]